MVGRFTVSPMIKAGHYDWVLRIDTPLLDNIETKLDNMFYRKQQSKTNGGYYFIYNYDKKFYTLEQVMQIRNEKLAEFENKGWRGGKNSHPSAIRSTNISRLNKVYDIPLWK